MNGIFLYKEDEMSREEPYNPLEKRQLARSVVQALLERDTAPLPPEAPFIGGGVYAIYYTGSFPYYAKLSQLNKKSAEEIPIYVGKAVPTGRRKGGASFDVTHGTELFRRLNEHSETIKAANNLNLHDFYCRYLVVDDIWIPLGEALLIQDFRPVWNVVVDGFGNHDPGSGRYQQKKSPWDALHPGRNWAEKLQPQKDDIADIESAIAEHIKEY